MRLSVTVSIFAEIIGIFRLIFFDNFVLVFTSPRDLISDIFGTSKTSSYVKAVLISIVVI